MIRRLLFPALAAAFAGPRPPPGIRAPTAAPATPLDGALLRPAGVERWVLVGASLGLGYSDATEDGPGMFHRVYLEPRRLRALPPDRPIPRRHHAGPLDPAAGPPGAAEPCGLDRGGARGAGAGGEGSGAVSGAGGRTSTSGATRRPRGRCPASAAPAATRSTRPGTTSSCSSIPSFGIADRARLASCRSPGGAVCYRQAKPIPHCSP